MPDLGILGWIIIGLLAGALAGALVPGRQAMGCLGTMLVGIVGGLIGGWLWVNVLNQDPAGGWLWRARHRHPGLGARSARCCGRSAAATEPRSVRLTT